MGGATSKPDRAGRVPARARVRVQVRVRPAGLGDTAALRRLRHQADAVHARLMPDYFREPDEARDFDPPVADRFSAILVAETSDGVAGYVTVKVVDTPRDPAMTPRRRAYVDTIVVDQPRRRQGVARALMRAAADWARARDAGELVLTVWSDNRAAEALYQRLGYQPIARVLRRSTREP